MRAFLQKNWILLAVAAAGLALLCVIVSMRGAAGAQESAAVSPTPLITPEPAETASPATAAPVEAATPSPSQTPEAVPSPEPTDDGLYVVSMVGDCTFASVQGHAGYSGSFEKLVGDDLAYPFAKTADYFKADDFTIANLECALTDYNIPTPKTFNFRGKPAYTGILTEGGVEFVTLANNHSRDYGSTGLEDTEQALDEAGIGRVGNKKYELWETESGLKVGVCAYTLGAVAADVEAGVRALKNAGAEIIIVAVHWGVEGSYRPLTAQKTVAHAAIDAGADIVYGSHPHVLQPMEEYGGGYIFYSLGNWSFGGNVSPRDMDTAIAQVSFERDGSGAVSAVGYALIPCSISGAATNNFQPVPYEEGTDAFDRAMSKLDGSFRGPDLLVEYTETPAPEESAEPTEPPTETEPPAETETPTEPADPDVPPETPSPTVPTEPTEPTAPDVPAEPAEPAAPAEPPAVIEPPPAEPAE